VPVSSKYLSRVMLLAVVAGREGTVPKPAPHPRKAQVIRREADERKEGAPELTKDTGPQHPPTHPPIHPAVTGREEG